MKAIIVVDIKEGGKFYADVYQEDNNDMFVGRYYPKPMPKKKRLDTKDLIANTENVGWNDCLEELDK